MNKHSSFEKPHDAKAKILLIGNAGVGKSSILLQFSQRKFTHSYYNTIGVDYKIKYLFLHNKTIKLQIWDTAGQDRFKTITTSYYRGADAIVVVYDITERGSFENVRSWMDEIGKYSREGVVRVIVGNKKDLEERRQVKYEEGLQMEELGVPFRETSARFQDDVMGLFEGIVEKIASLRPEEEKQTASKTRIELSSAQNPSKPETLKLNPQKMKGKAPTNKKCCSS